MALISRVLSELANCVPVTEAERKVDRFYAFESQQVLCTIRLTILTSQSWLTPDM